MKRQFDLVVIGTGAAGSVPAHKCRAAGWQVAVIDELPYGGTCALRGCDPKKVLVGAGELTECLAECGETVCQGISRSAGRNSFSSNKPLQSLCRRNARTASKPRASKLSMARQDLLT